MHSHAQYEIQMYAQSIYTLLKEKFPLTFEAFEDYVLNCESFSRMELHLLKELLKNNKLTIFTEARAEDMGMSRREYVEFSNKILKISNFNK